MVSTAPSFFGRPGFWAPHFRRLVVVERGTTSSLLCKFRVWVFWVSVALGCGPPSPFCSQCVESGEKRVDPNRPQRSRNTSGYKTLLEVPNYTKDNVVFSSTKKGTIVGAFDEAAATLENLEMLLTDSLAAVAAQTKAMHCSLHWGTQTDKFMSG
eukprot:4142427-Amphidinium_carterae.1